MKGRDEDDMEEEEKGGFRGETKGYGDESWREDKERREETVVKEEGRASFYL